MLIPHCSSQFNEQGKLQGQIDSPLSDSGKRAALKLAWLLRDLPISALHCSDLSRCVETALPLADILSISPSLGVGLRGRHYGRLQGLTYREIELQYPIEYRQLADRDPTERFSDENFQGESLVEFEARALREICNLIDRHSESALSSGVLACVSHGGVIDCLVRRACAFPIDLVIPNCRLFDPLSNFFLVERTTIVLTNREWSPIWTALTSASA